jgi:tRNA pseudouridine13 synthase
MKDRWAVTRQWFSVHLPGKVAPNFSDLNGDEITVLKQTRHPRKLRRGVHKENLFRIRLRELQGDRNYLADRLDIITRQGVPNYFGEQRFGRGAKNLSSAQRWFAGAFKPRRNQQGFFLSAARSFLFNQILSLRVNDQSWLNYLPGDIMMLNGTHSVFKPALDEELSQRLTSGDVHATAAMYGKTSDMAVSDDCAQLEEAVFSAYPELCEGLIAQGLKAERRALRLVPQQLQCRWLDNENLELSFKLPSGCFATSVMAELLHYTNAEQRD